MWNLSAEKIPECWFSKMISKVQAESDVQQQTAAVVGNEMPCLAALRRSQPQTTCRLWNGWSDFFGTNLKCSTNKMPEFNSREKLPKRKYQNRLLSVCSRFCILIVSQQTETRASWKLERQLPSLPWIKPGSFIQHASHARVACS